ncbi:SDR family NAD(P)-dependent oxidoreductase [Falsiroseomonas stagni]|uniref:NADP-dependent 3-hydroxy acid dehydrogenase YdfG n=1 Tax=Falsiroseomonas stagni DSM 19981 TaxID=1123062 RepID=A0A1I4CU80_9PROT|nr:SDR family oxidoreductase [Falsiroseomonas stagni]SFK84812.1 NADP-dependent 3-hydroxy acid dehydrogenase YdfG [Falsiroseomonas stagni DSM 19981]
MNEDRDSAATGAGAPLPAGRLAGRRIVVTGAASGIGLCTARLFASEGARLILLDRAGDSLAPVAAELGAHACAVDVTDEPSVAAAIADGAAALGGIDGVVNAAGIMIRGMVAEVDAARWRQILEVNLTGTYIVVRACLSWLTQGPGSTIVTIGSAQGLLPNAPGFTAYAASKGGVVNLSRALAAELAPAIRVNCICPGMVDTPMADGYRANVGNYALRRLADPLEIARAILFLTSAESSYVTGATLAADGGRSFH